MIVRLLRRFCTTMDVVGFLAITKPFQPSVADAVGNAPAPMLITQTEPQMKMLRRALCNGRLS